eukprot:CAMPEP_0114555870 /NCGR_PEP_ID=MMETSP0114-20121206/8980_1 /TAXON_ID=31324 /ORGANISM="Goniomonas sp, Strain m" /LENGTH=298 /DNA_ID=CAMNT_0001741025 /DNA_START=11 /DNA_END=907 /DNA_ORIENTATION=+
MALAGLLRSFAPRVGTLPVRMLSMSAAVRERTWVSQDSPKSQIGVVDYPKIKGASEIHIFLNPLNPSKEWVQRYDDAVAEFNKTVQSRKGAVTQMRPVYLCLNFRTLGDVFVMQSARHVTSDSNDYIIEEAYYDGKFFADRGFDVIRHKIEAYGGCDGVPLTDEEALKYPNRYWEFHLRVNRNGDAPSNDITKEEIAELKKLSEEYTEKWQVPVPLSYNAYKEGKQRFLNFRVGGCGRETALSSVQKIKDDLAANASFKHLEVGKSHTEYVWYDDNRNMDRGWIDFTSQEQKSVLNIQ